MEMSCQLPSRPGRYPLDRKLGGTRTGLEAVARRKESHQCPCREMNPSCPARSLVSILTVPSLYRSTPTRSSTNATVTDRTLAGKVEMKCTDNMETATPFLGSNINDTSPEGRKKCRPVKHIARARHA